MVGDFEHRAHNKKGFAWIWWVHQRGRISVALNCSLSADAPCLLAGKECKDKNSNDHDACRQFGQPADVLIDMLRLDNEAQMDTN